MAYKDLVGKRFDSGVVVKLIKPKPKHIKSTGRVWEMLCDCGKTYYATTSNLNANRHKSCGCANTLRIIGKKYGRGTVVEFLGVRKGRKYWKLQCDCGNTYQTCTDKLKNKHTKSCGCIMHPPEYGEIKAQFWYQLKGSAKSRNIPFMLDRKYLWDLFLQQDRRCALSDLEIKFAFNNKGHKIRRETTASLDRIDSSKCYEEGNVQWVHRNLNIMKWTLSQQEFIDICRLVTENNQ